VAQSDGTWATVVESAYQPQPDGVLVFNLEVEHFHTYCVAQTGLDSPIVVHNVTRECQEIIEEAAKRATKKAAPKTHGHHSDPKFMGGDPKQPRTPMSPEQHRQLHKDLNDFLRGKTDAAGNHMRPQRGNPADRIQENFSPAERQAAMAEFYKKFGDKYPDAARDFFKQHPHLK